MPHQPVDIDILILGAGWLSQFLLPFLTSHSLTYTATTTTGRNNTLKFIFDASGNPSSSDKELFARLPSAKTVLITFPIKGKEALDKLIRGYEGAHGRNGKGNGIHWILLGSTGIYSSTPPNAPGTDTSSENAGNQSIPSFQWYDNTSEATSKSERWEAEEHLINTYQGCVLNLAGLYGEPVRDARIWERAVPNTKGGLRGKKSVHFVHGMDVARVVVKVCEMWSGMPMGGRWVVSDGRVYDWWELVWDAATHLQGRFEGEDTGKLQERSKGNGTQEEGQKRDEREGELIYRKWILELMEEEGVRALPRPVEMLGRGLDSRNLWRRLGITPVEERFQWPKEKES